MESLKPKDAAKLIGISYPTIKHWIYDGKIESAKARAVITGFRSKKSND